MTWIDWLIVIVPSIVVIVLARRVARYVTGASDFLTAGRAAGRYLVSVADGMAAMGLITAIGMFEVFYNSGFGVTWWSQLQAPILMFIALFGFIIYRYRQTRAMTTAQFFEMRYSRNFRIFMGFTAFISGIINYGIFPIVGARFFIYFCRLPTHFVIGSLSIPMEAILSAAALMIALYFVLRGGQLQIMITDFVQGMFCGVLFVVVAIAVLWAVKPDQMFFAMSNRAPGESMLNPFDTWKLGDFNIWYVLISLFSTVYTFMSWQGNAAYNASAINPHEAKMGKIIASWRMFAQTLMFTLLGLAAVTIIRHPDFASSAASIQTQVGAIAQTSGEAVGKQMLVPIAIGELLPVGVKGCFVVIMLFLMVSTDCTYLHSWGSILIQDCVLPILNREPSRDAHLLMLRSSIVGVAIFAFIFGLTFTQTDYIFFFMNVTGAIYLGGAGAAIIGGLYWKRGTSAGAWGAMVVGSGLAVLGIVAPKIWQGFPLNGNWMMFISMTSAIATYILLSLVTCRTPHNMDQLLHNGAYAVQEDRVEGQASSIPAWQRKIIGIDENFSGSDRRLAWMLFAWTMLMFAVFITVTFSNLFSRWTEHGWWSFFAVMNIYLPLVVSVVTTIWFTIGGMRDFKRLFAKLRDPNRDTADVGLVSHEQNRALPQSTGKPVETEVAVPVS
jgi:SSS family solute:Na+ symporter